MKTFCVKINHRLRVSHKHLEARHAADAFDRAVRVLRMEEITADSAVVVPAEECRKGQRVAIMVSA